MSLELNISQKEVWKEVFYNNFCYLKPKVTFDIEID